MSKSEELGTKEKILKAAEELFAEKGFEGARVDKIADRAEVNKASIYYYFDNKAGILDYLISSLIKESEDIFLNIYNQTSDMDDREKADVFIDSIMKFALERRDIFRIALIESLKKGNENWIILEIIEAVMNNEFRNKFFAERGIELFERQDDRFITEVFPGIWAMIGFAVFSDKLEAKYDVTKEEMKKRFLKSYKQTHPAFKND